MPSRSETAYAREPRVLPTAPQMQHRDMAQSTPLQNAARNEGRPPVAATPRPAAFNGGGVPPRSPSVRSTIRCSSTGRRRGKDGPTVPTPPQPQPAPELMRERARA